MRNMHHASTALGSQRHVTIGNASGLLQWTLVDITKRTAVMRMQRKAFPAAALPEAYSTIFTSKALARRRLRRELG